MSSSQPQVDLAQDWQPFFEMHRAQLDHLGLPKGLWKKMHAKLMTNQRLDDPGQPFAVERAPADVGGFQLRATKKIPRWSEVWVVPHIVSGTKTEIFDALVKDPKGCQYLWDMMDLDNIVEENPEDVPADLIESIAKPAATTSEAKASKAATPASKDEPDVTPDPVMIEVLLSQVEGLTREKAEEALIKTNNDLMDALHLCGPRTEVHEMAEEAERKYGQAMGNTEIAAAEKRHEEKQNEKKEEETKTDEKKQEENNGKPERELTPEEKKAAREKAVHLRKAKTVFECLFKFGYVGSYYVARPRDEEGALRPDEVITKYYVMSPMGSAITVSDQPNVRTAPFVCITLNNASYSIVWPEKDINEGDLVTRAPLTLN